jgi:nucleoside-diphosphate-sugar epimerase
MPHALIIGGTGLVGRAVARRLLADGWTVTVTGRDPAHLPADVGAAGARFVRAEPDDPAALGEAAGDGADLLVACICYTAAQARLLLPLARHATSTVMISSKAVYVDDAGRHSNSDTPPRFGGPVTEEQALGYQPVGDYATTVTDEVHWLVERCRVDGAAKLPPELDERFFVDRFDYAAEDDYLARPPR